MDKKSLVKSLSEKSGVTLKDAETFLKAFVETVEETVANGETVSIVGFGAFEPRKREARVGRNPKTGEEIQIEATTVPAFKVGKNFKEIVKASVK